MSNGRMTMVLAAVGAMGLFAVGTAMAQQTPEPGTKIYPLHFETGSATIHSHDQDTIRGVAASMASNPGLTATIIGKADTVGSAEFNEKLSERRAVAVFDALVHDNKIAEDRVQLRWAGEQMPYIPTEDEKPELLNRLVEIAVK